MLSNADGTIQPPTSYAAGEIPTALAVGDFNRDGRLDLVVADAGTNELLLLLGNGDGTFQASGSFAAGSLPRSLTVGDFNGDGIADVAVTGAADGKVRVLLGTARGTLEPAGTYEAGIGWISMVAADLDGRGKRDLVWVNAITGTLSTLRGRGDGTFAEIQGLASHTATASSTTLATLPTSSAIFGQAVTLTATVSPTAATGKVTFYDGTTILGVGTLAGGRAVVSTILLAAGNRSLTALYGGDATYASSLSKAVALTVNTNASAAFVPAVGVPFTAGYLPSSVAVGDFNGDGKADFAVANSGDNTVSVFLGNGSGGFNASAGSPFAVTGGPHSIAVGDFNGDGKPDLLVASNNGTVTLLLGDGNGGFTAGWPLVAGDSLYSIVVADFNGDGNADVAVANFSYQNGSVAVFLGNGNGYLTAAPGSPFLVGADPDDLAVADFNGDGRPDLAVANFGSHNMTILLGDGGGGFTPTSGSPIAVGISPDAVAVGDFNGDGKEDLAIGDLQGGTVTVLLGDGTGGFTVASGSPFNAGGFVSSIAVGDFNGDGKQDLAVNNDVNGGAVMVLLGDGSGGFPSRIRVPAGDSPVSLAVADFNGDGIADLVVVNQTDSNNVVVLLGHAPSSTTLTASPNPSILGHTVTLTATENPATATGQITFYDGTTVLGEAPLVSGTAVLTSIRLQTGERSLVAHYSGDSRYASNLSTAVMMTVNSRPALGFAPVSGSYTFPVGLDPRSLAVGDFNGDGRADLAIANFGGNNVTVLLGNGAGGFTAAGGSPFAVGDSPSCVAVGDFNGDGNLDLAVANLGSNNVTVLLGNGSGGFTPAAGSPFTVGTGPSSVAVGDFNLDGNADLVVANNVSGDVSVLLGDGSGGFTVSLFGTGGFTDAVSVAVGDINGDGKPDLILVDLVGYIWSLLGDGSGNFTAQGFLLGGTSPFFVAVGDFNGDGKLDFAVANVGSNNVSVFLGDGTGNFTQPSGSPFAAGNVPGSIAVGDFNGDGKPDLAIPNHLSNNVTLLLGDGTGNFTPASGSPFTVGINPTSAAMADFNGDGVADLAVAQNGSNDVAILLGIGVVQAPRPEEDFRGIGRSDALIYDPCQGRNIPL